MCVQGYDSLSKIRIIPANAKVKKKKEMRFIDSSTHQGFGHYNFNFLFSLNSKFCKEALDDIFTRLDIGVNSDV